MAKNTQQFTPRATQQIVKATQITLRQHIDQRGQYLPTIASAGDSLPQGQYEGMVFGQVTLSQTGFFFPSATPMDGS